MASVSTASSGTDDRDSADTVERSSAPAPIPASATDHDPARRAFFRQSMRQAVTAAGQVAGMADIVGRTTGGATSGLLGLLGVSEARPRGAAPLARRPAVRGPAIVAGSAAADGAYRSPFRLEGETLRILDQRAIPERLEEVVARRGSDVVHYLRRGVCSGGPLLAQLAAYGQALTARERASQPASLRDQELRRTRDALLEARPASPLLRWALARLEAVAASMPAGTGSAAGAELAAALRIEADAVAGDVQLGLAIIAEQLTAMLSEACPDGPIGVLLHGDPGALHGGLVGSGITALRQLHAQGRELHVIVTESQPSGAGLRLASWELRQAGLDHSVVPDAALAWVLDHEPIAAVIIAAEGVAADGDSAAILGARAVGQVAEAVRRRRDGPSPRLLVTALTAAIDPAWADGEAMPVDVPRIAGQPERYALPASDVIAAEHISALVTERGVASPVDRATVARLLAAVPIADPAVGSPAGDPSTASR